jgi:hypothetical protein
MHVVPELTAEHQCNAACVRTYPFIQTCFALVFPLTQDRSLCISFHSTHVLTSSCLFYEGFVLGIERGNFLLKGGFLSLKRTGMTA